MPVYDATTEEFMKMSTMADYIKEEEVVEVPKKFVPRPPVEK